jgi:DNA-binding NtrC family response regulator
MGVIDKGSEMQTALRDIDTFPTGFKTRRMINALLLDDSTFDRLRIRRMSRETGMPIRLDEIASLDGLAGVLDAETFDLILIDYQLSDGNGLQAIDIIQNHPKNGLCPTIMVAGGDNPEIAVRAMKMGCIDYLAKAQLSANTLRNAVVEAIERTDLSLMSEGHRKEAQAQLSQAVLAQFREALQPEVAGIVRSVRTTRISFGDESFNFPAELEALEARCVGLWALLTNLTLARKH